MSKPLKRYKTESERIRTWAALWAACMSTLAAVKLLFFGG